MKNLINYSCLFCLLLFLLNSILLGCSQKKDNINLIDDSPVIKLISIETPLNNDNIILKNKILLDIPSGVFIGIIDKIIFTSNYFFLLDIDNTKSVTIYTEDGKLVKQLRFIGNGPGEYINLNDIEIDHNNKQILFLDGKNNIIIYDYNGKYITTININKSVYKFNKSSEGKEYIFYSPYSSKDNNDIYNLYTFNLAENRIIQGYQKYSKFNIKNKLPIEESNNLILVDDCIYFSETLNDTIFCYDTKGRSQHLAYVLELGNDKISLSDFDKPFESPYHLITFFNSKSNHVYHKPFLLKSHNILYSQIVNKKNLQSIILDTDSHRGYVLNNTFSSKDGELFELNIKGVINDKFIHVELTDYKTELFLLDIII